MTHYYSHENLSYPIQGEGPHATLSELDLFSRVPIQREVEKAFWEQVHCEKGGKSINQKEVIWQILPAAEYVDLNDSYMDVLINLRKKKPDGTFIKPTAAEKVNVINGILYGLFKGMTWHDKG